MNSEKHVSSTSPSGMSESNKASTMERNSLMSSIKGCSSSSSTNKMIMVTDEQKQAYNNNVGYLWPPRSYACSFCKREFRSAQALGGHMNVHRRDRARLRLHYSPPLSPDHHHHHHLMLNLNVSPNPNPKSPSPPPCPSTLTASVLPCNLASPPQLLSKWVSSDDPLPSSSLTKDCKFRNTTLGLSLQIGHSKEDLDLELRLGYP